MPFDAESISRALETRKERRSAQVAATERPGNGWLLFPDAPPGVGWVLAPPSTDKHGVVTEGGGQPRRYYHSREAALLGLLRMKSYGIDPGQPATAPGGLK